MPASTAFSSPGSAEATCASSALIALTQLLVPCSTHVSMVELKPTSLPPTVIDTSVVDGFSAASWLEITELVVAPAQATDT